MCEISEEFCSCKNPKIINEIEGATLIVRCLICGASAATTNPNYFRREEWVEDEKVYQLWLDPKKVEKTRFVRLFQEVAKNRMLEAASKYSAGKPTLLYEGVGEEFYTVVTNLSNLKVEYEVKPPYPYNT